MMAESDRRTRQTRRAARLRVDGARRLRRHLAVLGGAGLVASALAACGTSGAATGPVTLTYYLYPDTSAATSQAVAACTKQSHGKYTISYQQLPTAADGQRLQLVRRLAAHDNTIDIMGLDVTWEAEFAQAGWLRPWTGTNKAQAVHDTLRPMLDTATWSRPRQTPGPR